MVYTIGNLLNDILPRVAPSNKTDPPSGISIMGAATSIQSLIAKKMIARHSDLLAKGDLGMIISALGYKATLPDDFISMAERPSQESLLANWMAGTVTGYDPVTGSLQVTVTYFSGTETLSSWIIATSPLPGSPSVNVGTSTDTLTPALGGIDITTESGIPIETESGLSLQTSLTLNASTGMPITVGSFVLIFSDADSTNPPYSHRRRLQPNFLLDDEEDHDYQWWSSYGAVAYYDSWLVSEYPTHYKIIDSTIFIRPKPIAGIKITGKYFQLPSPFSQLADIIPWNNKFDELFREGVVLIINTGSAVPEADGAFAALIRRELDSVIDSRSNILPEYRTRRSQWL